MKWPVPGQRSQLGCLMGEVARWQPRKKWCFLFGVLKMASWLTKSGVGSLLSCNTWGNACEIWWATLFCLLVLAEHNWNVELFQQFVRWAFSTRYGQTPYKLGLICRWFHICGMIGNLVYNPPTTGLMTIPCQEINGSLDPSTKFLLKWSTVYHLLLEDRPI